MSNNDENGSIHKNINLEVHEKNNVNSDDSRELPVVTDMIPKSPDNVELHDNVQTDNISVLTNNTYPTFVPPKKEYTIQELQQMLAEKEQRIELLMHKQSQQTLQEIQMAEHLRHQEDELRKQEQELKEQKLTERQHREEQQKLYNEKYNQYITKYRIQKRRYEILDKIRINCVNLTAYHNNRYHLYKNLLFTIFRVPLIILNGVNSFFSVGLQKYMHQEHVSVINAIISLVCGILTSIELLLNLQKRMELELESAKEYYKLGVDIYTELSKEPDDRGEKGDLSKFLNEKHNIYQTLHQKSNAINASEKDFDDEFELYIIQVNDIDTFYPDTDSITDVDRREKKGRNQFALQRGDVHRPSIKPNDTGFTSNRKNINYTTDYCRNICNSLLHIMTCYICKKESLPPPKYYNDDVHDIESPENLQEMVEPPPIPRHVYCGDHNTDTDEEQYHHDVHPYNRHITTGDVLKSYRPSIDMNNISDTHRKTTRQFAIRKKKKLTDVFKF